jgi:hypothetical protein
MHEETGFYHQNRVLTLELFTGKGLQLTFKDNRSVSKVTLTPKTLPILEQRTLIAARAEAAITTKAYQRHIILIEGIEDYKTPDELLLFSITGSFNRIKGCPDWYNFSSQVLVNKYDDNDKLVTTTINRYNMPLKKHEMGQLATLFRHYWC